MYTVEQDQATASTPEGVMSPSMPVQKDQSAVSRMDQASDNTGIQATATAGEATAMVLPTGNIPSHLWYNPQLSSASAVTGLAELNITGVTGQNQQNLPLTHVSGQNLQNLYVSPSNPVIQQAEPSGEDSVQIALPQKPTLSTEQNTSISFSFETSFSSTRDTTFSGCGSTLPNQFLAPAPHVKSEWTIDSMYTMGAAVANEASQTTTLARATTDSKVDFHKILSDYCL